MERLLGTMVQAGQTQSLSDSHGLEGADRVCVWELGATRPSTGTPPPRRAAQALRKLSFLRTSICTPTLAFLALAVGPL